LIANLIYASSLPTSKFAIGYKKNLFTDNH
jgi:hypothetical protein